MAKEFHRGPRLHHSVGKQLAGFAGIGALALCCAVVSLPLRAAQTAADTGALQNQQAFNIPAQDVASALIAFGQQSGLQVSVGAALLSGRQAQAVNGHMSNQQALTQLLGGSGVGWEIQAGVVLVYRLPEPTALDPALEIGNTIVLGNTPENSYLGQTVIDQRAIQAFPGANGDITTLLRMHPSVQFNNSQQSANSAGEIDPANISINGAKYYQNNFMIDGITINNDLDPGAQSYGQTRQFDSAPSNSHGIALDADLLQEVRVYDSNVPAEYGGFNGGVVDAITRQPSQALHGKLSASMTRSAWTRYHISSDDQQNFDNASSEQYQPEFEKLTVRGTLEGHLTEDFGAILNFSQKRSTIPLNGYDNGYQSPNGENQRDQTRRIDNYLLKTYWTVNERLTLDSSFTYAPQENKYFEADRRNSDFTTENGGYQASFKAGWEGDRATWTHKLALTDLTSSRDSAADDIVSWYYSDAKNWGNPSSNNARSVEGAFGSLNQRQRGITYNLKAQWLPLQFAGLQHTFTSGIELSHTVAEWERENDVNAATAFTRDDGTTCSGGDSLCSVSPLLNGASRQWANRRSVYGAGRIEVTENKYALYLQDSLQLGRLGLRPGARLEGDDYMQKKTLAPRFAGDYDFFGDRSTLLVFGANRYYGRNLFKYRLADGRNTFNTSYTRSSQTAEWVGTTQKNTNRFSTLDIPYDDELMLGLEQRWLNTDFKLKYVHREGKDQIVRASARAQNLPTDANFATTWYTYTNEGQGKSDNLGLTITPLQDLRWQGTRTSLQWAFDWSRSEDAYVDYESSFTAAQLQDDDVLYDGKLIKYSELPARDFNRPWTARMTAITEIPQWNLTVSNFLRYRGKYDQLITTGNQVEVNGNTVTEYEVARVGAAPTWDMRFDWEVPFGNQQSAFVAVDITNLTDRVNEISSTSGSVTYEVGRQYWLEVGYRF